MRVCSFLASGTEIVCALGLADRLVAISHECDYPEEIRGLPVVVQAQIDDQFPSSEIDRQVRDRAASGADLYRIDETALAHLAPDVLVTQGLCAVCAVSAASVSRAVARWPLSPRIVELSPHSLGDVLADIGRVGAACGAQAAAERVAAGLQSRLDRVREAGRAAATAEGRPRVLCLEWLDPPFNAGHWLPEMVELAGGEALLAKAGQPSVPISWEEIAQSAPDVLLITACGFTVTRTRRELDAVLARRDVGPLFDALPAVRKGRAFLGDGGQLFSRSGPRLVDATEYLLGVLHPDYARGAAPNWAIQPIRRSPLAAATSRRR